MPASSSVRLSRSARSGLVMPVGRIARHLKKQHRVARISAGAPVYLAGVLEYLLAELLDVSGTVTHLKKRKRITPHHIKLALKSDDALRQLIENSA